MNKPSDRQLGILRLLMCLLLIGGSGWAPSSWAGNCTVSPHQPVTLPFPSTIAAPGTVGLLSTPVSAVINFSCDHFQGYQSPLSIQTMVQSIFTPVGTDLQFDTGLPDFKLRVGIPNSTFSTPTFSVGTLVANGQGSTLSVTVTGQLYRINAGPAVTLQVGSGANLTGSFGYYYSGNSTSTPDGTFTNTQIQGVALTANASSCTVNSPANFTVMLPTISATALAGPAGTTAGVTPFNLSYSCAAGTTVIPSMTSTMADPTIVGLMDPISGNATNVGLRVMNSALTAGVDLKGANQPSVVSSGTTLTLPYYVDYYRTNAAPINAGPVTGTITYTLNYQ